MDPNHDALHTLARISSAHEANEARLRSALERIKDFDPFGDKPDEDVNWWIVAMDLRQIAREALEVSA